MGLMTAFTDTDEVGEIFAKESEMAKTAALWLKTAGMAVRSEFVTPWGICDLVGLRFNQKRVEHRLKLKQTKALSSITRAVLLLQIPDVEKRKSVSLERLIRKYTPSIPAEVIETETARLIADHFVVLTTRGGLQKVNGWIPLQDRLVAIELKLLRIEEAMRQAMNNLGFAEESYVGLPTDVARRVASNPSRWSMFFEAGVGLLSVSPCSCEVLVQARKSVKWTNSSIQLYCVEKFWRTRLKDSLA
jgi:hypothetical protein